MRQPANAEVGQSQRKAAGADIKSDAVARRAEAKRLKSAWDANLKLSPSAKASTVSLNAATEIQTSASKKRTLFAAASASSSDLRADGSGMRSSSTPARKRKWWFRKDSLFTSQHSLLYDRMVSRRLVSAIAAWHDIHTNLLQLSLSRRRQASRTRKKQQAQLEKQKKHHCERKHHNHHYHCKIHGDRRLNSVCSTTVGRDEMGAAQDAECIKRKDNNRQNGLERNNNSGNADIQSTSPTLSSSASNLVEVCCQHPCHCHYQRHHRQQPGEAIIDIKPTETEDANAGENRCGSLCAMNSICCSSACSLLSCSSASGEPTSSSASPTSSLSAASLSSSPTHAANVDTKAPTAHTLETSSASGSSLQLSVSSTKFQQSQGDMDESDDERSRWAMRRPLSPNSEPVFSASMPATTMAAETESGELVDKNNRLQLPTVQYLRQKRNDFLNRTLSQSKRGCLKAVHSFNRSSPNTPLMQSPQLSPCRNSIAVSDLPTRRYFQKTKTYSPHMERLYRNEKSFAESGRYNNRNYGDLTDAENCDDFNDYESYGEEGEDEDEDEDLISDETLDEILEAERKNLNKLSLSNPELTAIEIKQMFPDLSDHWRWAIF